VVIGVSPNDKDIEMWESNRNKSHKPRIAFLILAIAAAAFAQGLPVTTSIAPDNGNGEVRWFGWDITGGDFNGDGVGDIAIGAPRSDRPMTHPDSALGVCGRVDIYFGPIPPGDHDGFSLPPGLTIFGEDSGGQLGISVSNAGDFNGDGIADLLIGANAVASKGAAYIYYGGPSMDELPDIAFGGEFLADNFGYSSTGIGDQNDDNFDDILIGSLYHDAIGPRTGRCYVFYGGAPADTLPDLVIDGLDSLDDFGVNLDGPNDFNGDGGPDFAIGAVQAGGYWFKPGEAYVFLGGSLLDPWPDWTVTGTHPMEFFGGTVAALGDMDRDGFDEAAFGGYNHHEPPDSGLGRAVILFGDDGDTMTIIGDRPGQYFGSEVASAGDIDGDMRCELAISQAFDGADDEFGFVKIYGITSLPESTRVISVDTVCYNPGGSGDTWFAYRMAALRDVGGDDLPDFAITDPRMPADTGLYPAEGRVYIYSGWRVLFPIYAEVIEPVYHWLTACIRQGATFRLRQELGLEGLSATVRVECDSGTFEYTLDSAALSMPDDSTLVFTPQWDWVNEEGVEVTLIAASLPTGEELFEPVDVDWIVDLEPPWIRQILLDTPEDDPYPVFYWFAGGYNYDPELRDTEDVFIYSGSDTARPSGIFSVRYELSTDWIIAAPLSDLSLRAGYGDSVTVCLGGVHDLASVPCGPNYAEPSCITTYFYRNWSADLTFSASDLEPTVLTIGALPGMTDGYDPGGDIIMPPVPVGRVRAKLSLEDEGIPAFNSLLRDYRDADDDTIVWVILTEGDGTATMTWDSNRLPTGMFLLDGRVDMRTNSEFEFALGDTLELAFTTGPKAVFSNSYYMLDFGWQLLSSPLYLDRPEISHHMGIIDSVFNWCDINKWIYTYNSESYSYVVPDKWPTGKGLWIWIDTRDVSRCGMPFMHAGWRIDTLHTPVWRGWNQIGAPNEAVPSGGIGTEPPGLIFPYSLYGYDGDYFISDYLEQGHGYWILCDDTGELIAPFGSRVFAAKSAMRGLFETYGDYPPPPPEPAGIVEKPAEVALGVYPNPFNAACKIILGAKPQDIAIYDVTGRVVKRYKGVCGEIIWRGDNQTKIKMPNGIYLITSQQANSMKVILLR